MCVSSRGIAFETCEIYINSVWTSVLRRFTAFTLYISPWFSKFHFIPFTVSSSAELLLFKAACLHCLMIKLKFSYGDASRKDMFPNQVSCLVPWSRTWNLSMKNFSVSRCPQNVLWWFWKHHMYIAIAKEGLQMPSAVALLNSRLQGWLKYAM